VEVAEHGVPDDPSVLHVEHRRRDGVVHAADHPGGIAHHDRTPHVGLAERAIALAGPVLPTGGERWHHPRQPVRLGGNHRPEPGQEVVETVEDHRVDGAVHPVQGRGGGHDAAHGVDESTALHLAAGDGPVADVDERPTGSVHPEGVEVRVEIRRGRHAPSMVAVPDGTLTVPPDGNPSPAGS